MLLLFFFLAHSRVSTYFSRISLFEIQKFTSEEEDAHPSVNLFDEIANAATLMFDLGAQPYVVRIFFFFNFCCAIPVVPVRA